MSLEIYHNVYPATQCSTDKYLVFIHGWGMHGGVWDPVVEKLNETINIIVLDLPGFGRSPMPAGDYTLDYLCDLLAPIIPEKSLVCGWSLGGLVAAQLAKQIPEKILGLITVATNPKFVAALDWPHAMDEKLLKSFYEFLLEDWEGTLIRFLALQNKDSHSAKEDIRYFREYVYFYGLPAQKALREGLRILQGSDCRELIKALDIPVLMIFGEKDNLVPIAVMDDLPSSGKGNGNEKLQTVLIKGASHAPFVSNSDEFTNYVIDYLNRI